MNPLTLIAAAYHLAYCLKAALELVRWARRVRLVRLG